MDQIDKTSISRVIDRLAKTKAISQESRNEVFNFLGISRNVRKGKPSTKAISPPHP